MRLELQAVIVIVEPNSRCRDPFPGRYHRCMTHCGHQVPMAPRLNPQHAETALLTVKRDALDQTGQDFCDAVSLMLHDCEY